MVLRRNLLLQLATIAGFCGFLFFFGLGAFGLVGADEPRYAQVAREMLARRDLITPTLFGVPWLEKPPLYYWRAMQGYYFFGVKDWVARSPSAAAATLMVFVSYFFARKFRPGSQLNAALITAASAAVIGFARGAGSDMLLTAAFTIGMMCWWTWHQSARQPWLALFYFFIALGTLAKGPVAPFMAAVIIVVYAAVRRDLQLIWRTLWMPGILLFLVTALPWYIAVQVRNPQFFREFILHHNLERFATNRYHHKQPFWYYVPVLLLALMPWTALFVAALVDALRKWRERIRSGQSDAALSSFIVIWLLVVVLLISISQSKLPGYILPGIPAATLLIAEWLNRQEKLGWPLIAAQGMLSGLLLTLALLFPNLLLHPRGGVPPGAKLFAALVAAGVCLATVATLWRRQLQGLRFVVLVPVIVGLAFLLRVGAPVIDAVFSERPVAQDIAQLQGSRPVAVFRVSREVEYGLGFYRNQQIPRHERGETGSSDFLVIVPNKYQDELLKAVQSRRASHVGGFAPQHLEYFWISTPHR